MCLLFTILEMRVEEGIVLFCCCNNTPWTRIEAKWEKKQTYWSWKGSVVEFSGGEKQLQTCIMTHMCEDAMMKLINSYSKFKSQVTCLKRKVDYQC